jgi:hypothetical protein
MMPNRFASVLIAALLCSGSAALAQPAPAPSTGVAPVTVTGQPVRPRRVIQQQASDFVQHFAAVANPEIDQIARWHEPVCAQVEGLIPEQAALIKARIEGVAREVGLPAAWARDTGCKANVEIVFTDKPQALMNTVAKRRESLLGYYHFHDRNRLKAVTRPIQSWYVTATSVGFSCGSTELAFASLKDSNGMPVRNTGFPGAAIPEGQVDDPENTPPTGCDHAPHFTNLYTSAFANVFMVADSKALEGKDLGLVADYMVMLALSQPRSLDGCNALPSVVDRFAPSRCYGHDAPDGLTPADAAYLTGLYESDPEGFKVFEQSDITRRMAAILIKASTAGQPPAGTKIR